MPKSDMTLAEFQQLTAGMPPSARLLVQAPWGELMPALLITIEDLAEDDPVRADFPPDAIALAPKAS